MGRSIAAILTRDRPEILERSISMLGDHHPGITAVVIDDSPAASTVRNNKRALNRAGALGAAYHITRKAAAGLGREIDGALGRRGALDAVMARAGQRDISGLRNLAVAASHALGPSTLFLIDDDVVPCVPRRKLPCFLDTVESRHCGRQNAIIGGCMGGMVDDSYSGRLCRLCEVGGEALLDHEKHVQSSAVRWRFDNNPLWLEPVVRRPRPRRVTHVSGGMMAIRVDPHHIVPFPPGYDEDWNWCLLQSMLSGTAVLVDGHPSYHSPPALRRLGAAGIVWETLGDIMFYTLRRASATGRRFTLQSLSKYVSQNIAGGYAVGEITYTIRLLGRLAAGGGGAPPPLATATAARAAEHMDELSGAATLLRGEDLQAFAAEWFGMQAARAASLSPLLERAGLRGVIKGFLGGLTA